MVVGYSDPIDGCTDGSSYRENPDELKMAVIDDNAVVQKETSLIPNNVPAKIVDICSRTTADKDKDVETTVDVYSSSEESTAECESSSEDGDGVLELAKNNQTNQMVNQMKECKDFMVATNVHITNNYPPQPLSLDVEQLKNLADGSIYKSLWADDANLDESIEKAQAKVSYPFVKALAMAVTTTLVLVIVVVGLLLWQMKLSDSEGSTDSGCDDLPHNFSTRYVDRKAWFARKSKTPLRTFPSLPLKSVIIDTTGGFRCTNHFYCPNSVLELQNRDIAAGLQDIKANFVLAEDGYIYEARGWSFVGQDVPGHDEMALEIQFMGNFDADFPVCSNFSLPILLDEGVRLGVLTPQYRIYGKNQFISTSTMKPDSSLVKDMKNWARYDPTFDANATTLN